jgi:hypothetical protein
MLVACTPLRRFGADSHLIVLSSEKVSGEAIGTLFEREASERILKHYQNEHGRKDCGFASQVRK